MKTNQHRDNPSKPVITVAPVKLHTTDRKQELEVRISAPISGNNLPIILFAHGFGSSMYAYDPLIQFWAANGFVIIQPTFLDSRRYASQHHSDHGEAVKAFLSDPEAGNVWHQRIVDMKTMLDQLDTILSAVPALDGRVNRHQIAAAGHSFGAHTVASLMGAEIDIAEPDERRDFYDERVKAGILLSAAGAGGSALSTFAAEHFPYLNLNYSTLAGPTMVVAGDQDYSPLTNLGPEWFTDAYYLSPGANALLAVHGGEHMLGGISGYLVSETTDENPERVELIQSLTLAYLQKMLKGDDKTWKENCDRLLHGAHLGGEIHLK